MSLLFWDGDLREFKKMEDGGWIKSSIIVTIYEDGAGRFVAYDYKTGEKRVYPIVSAVKKFDHILFTINESLNAKLYFDTAKNIIELRLASRSKNVTMVYGTKHHSVWRCKQCYK